MLYVCRYTERSDWAARAVDSCSAPVRGSRRMEATFAFVQTADKLQQCGTEQQSEHYLPWQGAVCTACVLGRLQLALVTDKQHAL
jgi:hypothetical protein